MNTSKMELNLNEMSGAAGGSHVATNKANIRACRRLRDLLSGIYKKLFVPTETLD